MLQVTLAGEYETETRSNRSKYTFPSCTRGSLRHHFNQSNCGGNQMKTFNFGEAIERMNKRIKVTEFSDSQHGWLGVKRSIIQALGIADKVSVWSYQKGNTVYLEEDCDMSLFVNAMMQLHGLKDYKEWHERKSEFLDITKSYSHGSSPIRNYASYTVEKLTPFIGARFEYCGNIYTITEKLDQGKYRVKNDRGAEFVMKKSQVDFIKILKNESEK